MNRPNYPDLSSMTLKQLKQYAKSKGCTGYSGLDREEITRKIERWVLLSEGFDIRPEQSAN
ncbi:hypothetical protein [Microcoleus sp. FACHB-672]|uniref:hypothetical protein n=1 Tax=Microcoleus sp. FACHB-672 TaxID=2692825 RepID=UPI0016876D47|nr:hypothetical protein [Microcoleus sp. FACHB-672]MBD2039694.1 hypothetical protein [Microcoleus sp. FACHB-672]